MSDGQGRARCQVQIVNPHGLHMRPSTRFVSLATGFQANVWVHCDGRRINGKSILDMTGLAAECGARLEIEAEGDDAEAAITALAALVEARFHMDEESD